MIGFYDSGLGGLTILKQVIARFPHIATMYFADTARCPLGEKTNEEILAYTKSGVSFLFDQGCELVILACNTATAITIRELQNNWLPKVYPDKKLLGIVRPVSEKMLQIHTDKTINIGILATPATVNSGFYDEEMKSVGYKHIFSIPCSGLADAIEGQDKKAINGTIDKVFTQNQEKIQQLDVLILACTHYPIIRNEINKKLHEYGAKESIRLLSQGNMIAERLVIYLQNHPEIKIETGTNQYFVTNDPKEFETKMKLLFDINGTVLWAEH
jgi:glutamate racemase